MRIKGAAASGPKMVADPTPPDERHPMFEHILLATDGSDASVHAATLAVDLARVHGARLTALYVVDPYPYLGIGESNPMGFQAYMSAALDHAARAHSQVAALCDKGGKPVELALRMAQDVPAAEGIINAAKEAQADLIVVGSHGRSGLGRMLLGSVAGKVVAHSPLPVLIAR
jgi:nucleotide-binding universal stress UspA family protein